MINKYSKGLKRSKKRKTRRLNKNKPQTKRRINKRVKRKSKKRNRGRGPSLSAHQKWNRDEFIEARKFTKNLNYSIKNMDVKVTPNIMIENLLDELPPNIFIKEEYIDGRVGDIEHVYTERLNYKPANYRKLKTLTRKKKREYEEKIRKKGSLTRREEENIRENNRREEYQRTLLNLLRENRLIGETKPFYIRDSSSSSSSSGGLLKFGKGRKKYRGGFIGAVANTTSTVLAQGAFLADHVAKTAQGHYSGGTEDNSVDDKTVDNKSKDDKSNDNSVDDNSEDSK